MSAEVTRLRRMFEHEAWANAAALASLRTGPASDKARAWMAHIVGAEYLWLARLHQRPPEMSVGPDLDLNTIATHLTELAGEWAEFLEAVDADGLTDGVAYRNSKGEFWTSTVGDILTHVVLHAAYHRGQIASAVREAGGEPAYTDFIHAVRMGLIE